jgi:hypothetical protein
MMKKRLTPYIDSNAALGVFIEKKSGQLYFTHNGGKEGISLHIVWKLCREEMAL